MKNEKGFTLIELLGILVILSIIAGIAAPNINKQFEQRDENQNSIFTESIENASKIYVSKYYAAAVYKCSANADCVSFNLSDLENDGLIELKNRPEACKSEQIIFKKDSTGKLIYTFDGISNCIQP